ncbi:hypothetical protein VNO77_34313 [Canavalia gladiata]|uniref:Uncharacterized protein n=1 Tax=Canavalia gladiata TaxID=3824 RepID=A0AAN9KGH8_CANGL
MAWPLNVIGVHGSKGKIPGKVRTRGQVLCAPSPNHQSMFPIRLEIVAICAMTVVKIWREGHLLLGMD